MSHKTRSKRKEALNRSHWSGSRVRSIVWLAAPWALGCVAEIPGGRGDLRVVPAPPERPTDAAMTAPDSAATGSDAGVDVAGLTDLTPAAKDDDARPDVGGPAQDQPDSGTNEEADAGPPPDDDGCDPRDNALTTGRSDWDTYDCLFIAIAAKHGHPDPRLLKALSMWEADERFDVFAVSQDSPRGTPPGWTDAESKSYGLMQFTLACEGSTCDEMEPALLPNGRPNLTRDKNSSLWATSIFNPEVNLDLGIGDMVAGMNYFEKHFPGCTEREYVLMGAAGYNGGWGREIVNGCAGFPTARPRNYLTSVLGWYRKFAAEGDWPDPYPDSF